MKDTTTVLKTAVPFFRKGTNGKAVLILHGYNSYPGPFYEIAEIINTSGYTVSIPRLPGHGTTLKDFKRTSWKDWLNHAVNSYMDLAATHKTVSVVGLSMGGTMALILASRFNPDKICLLAPAMAAVNHLYYLSPVLRYVVPYIPGNWSAEEWADEDRIRIGNDYWTVRVTKQVAGIYKLHRIARSGLGQVKSPVLLMLSEKDTTVPMKAGDVIRSGLKECVLEKIVLKNSPHVLVEGPEKEVVYENVVRWLKAPA